MDNRVGTALAVGVLGLSAIFASSASADPRGRGRHEHWRGGHWGPTVQVYPWAFGRSPSSAYPGPVYGYGYYSEPPAYPPPPPPPAYYYEPPHERLAERQVERAPEQEAPAEAKEFIVYFPFDSNELTPAAERVIQGAADYQRQLGDAQLTIVGHTDTSGSEAYNQALSERRSQAVRKSLQAKGVSSGSVEMDWKGKRQLAVRTADGVKEPSNRRVTIVVEPRQTDRDPEPRSGSDRDWRQDSRRDADLHRDDRDPRGLQPGDRRPDDWRDEPAGAPPRD